MTECVVDIWVSSLVLHVYFPYSLPTMLYFADDAVLSDSGGGGPGRGGQEGHGGDPAIGFDRPASATTDMERQVPPAVPL